MNNFWLNLQKRFQEDKNFVMIFSVSLLMLLIFAVWMFNIRHLFPRISPAAAKQNGSLSWAEVQNNFDDSFTSISAQLERIKNKNVASAQSNAELNDQMKALTVAISNKFVSSTASSTALTATTTTAATTTSSDLK